MGNRRIGTLSRKTRARTTARARRRPWWLLAAGALALIAVAAWWAIGRETTPGAAGGAARSLASYRPPDIHALTVHPTDPATVIFGNHGGMLVSRDGGRTWDPLGPKGDAMGIAMPAGSSTVYAAGHDVFFRSDDGGRTWSSVRPALPGTDIHGFAASAVMPGRFYAYVAGNGLFRSDDGGSIWTRAAAAPGSTMSMTVASGGGQDILFASTMEGVQRSRDGGATWERVPELGGATVSASGSRVYAVAGTAVLVSSDGGLRWEQRSFPNGGATLAAPAASDPETVYVLAEGLTIWRSSDGGRTWERMS